MKLMEMIKDKAQKSKDFRCELGDQNDRTDDLIREISTEMSFEGFIVKPHYNTDEVTGATTVWLRIVHEDEYQVG